MIVDSLYRVRRAEERDVGQIVAAIEALLSELRDTPSVALPSEAEATCRRLIRGQAAGTILVADREEEGFGLVGVLTLSVPQAIHTAGPYSLIQELWVAPHHRSEGVGAALIEAAEEYCRKRGLSNLEVCLPSRLFPRLPATYRFYESCGFVEVGPRMRKGIE